MELFSSLKNAQVCCAFEIINFAVAHGRKISLFQIKKIAAKWQLVDYTELCDFLCDQDIPLLRQDEKNPSEYQLAAEDTSTIPCFFTRYELEHLGYILQQPLARLFLDEETIKKLKQALPLSSLQGHEYIKVVEPLLQYTPDVDIQDFRIILVAIEQGREISYEYMTNRTDQYISAIAVPYRLEYSAYDKRFWLILYDRNTQRTIKAKLNHIRQVAWGALHGLEEKTIRQAIARLKSPESLGLKVVDKKNALERCFLLFEGQERIESTQLDDNSYLITMEYFLFDEEEILRKLLYLGQQVVLVAPAALRQKLIEKIDRALALY